MQQLNIDYFFPLTEQVPLDLDFKPCEEHAKQLQEERWKNSVTITTGMGLLVGNGGTTWVNPSFTINVDQTPITIVSKKKPNFIKQFIYKSLGMKWKSE